MSDYTLNDVPSEVFQDYILPFIGLKEIGVLAMVSTSLRDLCGEEPVWKHLYSKTTKPKITDSSRHVGPYPSYTHKETGKIYHDRCLRNMDKEEFDKSWIANEVCPVSDSIRWLSISNPFHCTCLPNGVRFSSWRDIISPVMNINYPSHRYIAYHPKEQQKEYVQKIREEWKEYNRSKGLSTKNLCQCVRHYHYTTLGNVSVNVKYKNYKKMTLKKLKTKKKKELEKSERELEKAEKEFETHRKLWFERMKILKKNVREKEAKLNKSKLCMDHLDDYLENI